MKASKRPKILEIIVSSLPDAIEAEAGGADRLEVVRELDAGGLTPPLELVRQIAAAVRIPLRVILREQDVMHLSGEAELDRLRSDAIEIAKLGVDGLVAGYLKDHGVDIDSMRAIAACVPGLRLTFHRAFDRMANPSQAIEQLKTIPQIDRILTNGGTGTWAERKSRLHYWQQLASPEITILVGGGLREAVIADLQDDKHIKEIHVGRAARIPRAAAGRVSREQVAQIKGSSA